MTTRVFSTDTDFGTVSVLEASHGSLKPLYKINVGNGPRGTVKFTADRGGLVPKSAGNPLAEIVLGNEGLRGSASSPDGGQAFISIEDAGEVAATHIAPQTVVTRSEAAPGPPGLSCGPQAIAIYTSAFARPAKAVGNLTRPNTVSVIDLSEAKGDDVANAPPAYRDVDVGAGPCSVSNDAV